MKYPHDSEISMSHLIAPRADLRIGGGGASRRRASLKVPQRELAPSMRQTDRPGAYMSTSAGRSWSIARIGSGVRGAGPPPSRGGR